MWANHEQAGKLEADARLKESGRSAPYLSTRLWAI